MPKIAIVGSGVVGATIAYEFSQLADWEVVVVDSQPQPAQGATGAALGLLMGIISQKTKGRAWQLRQQGIEYYHHLIPQLQELTGLRIAHNSQGIVKLLTADDDLPKWQSLAQTRSAQGWPLELWDPITILEQLPHLHSQAYTSAVYSPADWQIHPAQLTQALVAAAQQQGSQFHWNTAVLTIDSRAQRLRQQLITNHGQIGADWIVIAAGLGSTALTTSLHQTIELIPVLGQAIHCRLPTPWGIGAFQPVITRDDVHLVPLGNGEYWVGATVEFPLGTSILAQPEQLELLWAKAIACCPALATADILHTWSGLRPRPVSRPAPVITQLPTQERVIIASGHYRNGVLLAPATAHLIQAMILSA
jgi:glycine/D-amino acid oxidase-like deaminating enzyme